MNTLHPLLRPRPRLLLAGLLAGLLLAACGIHYSGSMGGPRAPYRALRWNGETPEVRHNGDWHALVAIDEHEVEDIVRTAKRSWGTQWQKRFAEDLDTLVLSAMNVNVGDDVDLTLRNLETGRTRTFREVPMTSENRAALYEYLHRPTAAPEDEAVPLTEAAVSMVKTRPVGQGYPKLSPFDGLRWSGDRPEVYLDGEWYRARSIDGIAVGDILEHCRAAHRERWKKRFGEDLVQVLAEMGHDLGEDARVDLVLVPADGGEEVRRADVLMTHARRQAIRGGRLLVVQRVQREHAQSLPVRGGYPLLASTVTVDPGGASGRLTREEAEADLDQLEWLVRNVYSYRDLTGVDTPLALDTLRLRCAGGITRADFALGLTRFLGLFGDGHARIEPSIESFLPRSYTPFLVEETEEGLVALWPNRREFVEPKNNYLQQLENVPVGRWLDAARTLQTAGSPALVRTRAIRSLRLAGWLRRELGVAGDQPFTAYLTSAGRRSGFHGDFPLVDEKPLYGAWPREESQVIDGEIGYLRIPRMRSGEDFVDELHASMKSFQGTKGLVIDVRGNGGGSRRALLELFGYFMGRDDPPHVANVAAYRVPPGESRGMTEGHLADRHLFPLSSERWSDAARTVLLDLERNLEPAWKPDTKLFSVWHYMLLERVPGRHTYHYDRPVAVLMDRNCFSATDIFLGAFKGWRDVTLIGLPSGGGSGRARPYTLAHSGLTVKLSSMASFRATGEAYDGVGIQPDVLVWPQAEDFIGVGDAQLTEALVRLRR